MFSARLRCNHLRLCYMRRFTSQLLFAVLIALNAGVFMPAYAADTVCNFRARGLSLNFGVLNPSIVQDIIQPVTVATTFANMAGDCTGGGNMTISIVGPSSRQLVSGINSINYSILGLPISLPRPGNAPNGNPASGYATWFTPGPQLQGNLLWSAFADAPAGNYSDTVTISVNP